MTYIFKENDGANRKIKTWYPEIWYKVNCQRKSSQLPGKFPHKRSEKNEIFKRSSENKMTTVKVVAND